MFKNQIFHKNLDLLLLTNWTIWQTGPCIPFGNNWQLPLLDEAVCRSTVSSSLFLLHQLTSTIELTFLVPVGI